MDSSTILWIARGVIIATAVVMIPFLMKWKREGLLWQQFRLYFLVLGIMLLIVGNFVLTMSLTIQPHLSAFYGTYIGCVGVAALIVFGIWSYTLRHR